MTEQIMAFDVLEMNGRIPFTSPPLPPSFACLSKSTIVVASPLRVLEMSGELFDFLTNE
jgi:hypothetical protein